MLSADAPTTSRRGDHCRRGDEPVAAAVSQTASCVEVWPLAGHQTSDALALGRAPSDRHPAGRMPSPGHGSGGPRPAACSRGASGLAVVHCLDCGRRSERSRCPTCARRHDDWQARRKIRDGWTWGEIRARVHERDRACVRCGSQRRLQVHHRHSPPAAATSSATSSSSAPAATANDGGDYVPSYRPRQVRAKR